MARDGYRTLGSHLTPEEAGMAHDLLVSEGLDALLEDQALSAIDPLVRPAIGGAKLLVREEDAGRAETLLGEAGILAPRSAHPAEEVEIPEAEWSAPPPPEAPAPSGWPGLRVLLLVLAAAALALALMAEASRPRWPPFGAP